MYTVDINVSGLNPSPNSAVAQCVRVIAKDASGNVVFDGQGVAMDQNPNVGLEARGLPAGKYTFSAQACDEHGQPIGPLLTLGPVVLADDTSTLPSFVPTGMQVTF